MDINLYSPAGLRRLLGEESAAPLKKFGQNFLINPAVVERMIAESGLTGADGVLEIGPGPGALTSRLVPAARRVVAIEIDRKMVAVLKTTAPGAEVLEADIMRLDLAALIAEKFADCERVLVFGNLPYYITSPLLMLLIEQELPIASVTAMVQKEAAARLCAREGSRESGAVTLAVRYRSRPRILFDVSRGSFYPVPGVDSSVIQLVPFRRAERPVSEEKLFRLIRAAFAGRRKTLANSVSAGLALDKSAVTKALTVCGIAPAARAETLGVEQYIALTNCLCGRGIL